MKVVTNLKVNASSLTTALDERDTYTRHHCDRVGLLAEELGTACGLPRQNLVILHLAALFHDIGKIGIPDKVLLKPSSLDGEEWSVMKTHPEKGERIIRSTGARASEALAPIVRHHHESFDGSGYPDGLYGENIPLLSRILLVVDAYDAMGTGRPYHRSRNHLEVTEIMRIEGGRRFDPNILERFFYLIEVSPNRLH